jgi:hypothetical protein
VVRTRSKTSGVAVLNVRIHRPVCGGRAARRGPTKVTKA